MVPVLEPASRPSPGPADAYIAFYQSMTPRTLEKLDELVAPDVRFKDPFNDVRGVAAYKILLAGMFEAIPDIRFFVTHQASDGAVCFLRWRCEGTVRGIWRIEGMSELRFDGAGRVREHIDHWDAAAQVYERMPIIGGLLRLVRRRIAGH